MTREEAIRVFDGFKFSPREMEAVKMAQEALKSIADKEIECADCIRQIKCEDEERISADAIRKFVEWLEKSENYSLSKVIRCWDDCRYDQYLKVDINEILTEYEKERESNGKC